MSTPTVTLDEVARGIQDSTTNAPTKKVLEGLLNDYMDLQYGKDTPYTTGKQVIPSGATIGDVEKALVDESTEKIYKAVFQVISEVHKSGDLTPRSSNDGTWDPRFTPVLVLVTPNKK